MESTSNHFIQHVLNTFPLKDVDLRVLASDQLPPQPVFPFAYVVNTDVSTSKGIHYIALIARSFDNVLYIDSLALYQSPTWNIAKYLEKFKTVQLLNTKLQSETSWRCAFFALFFVYYTCLSWKHINLKDDPNILAFEKSNLKLNDRIVTMNLAFLLCKYFI